MTTAVVPHSRALVVLEHNEFIDVSLDLQIRNALKEVQTIQGQIEGIERQIGFTLHGLSFRYPEVAMKLREKLNKFRELQGMAPIEDEIDPVSQKNKDGTSEAEEQAKLDAEAEAAAKKAIEELSDDELTPKQRQAKFLERKRREKCKRLYLKLAKMTHPDKVKDPELNNVFHQAKKAYERLDLDVLEVMHKDVKDYTLLKGNRGKFRDFKKRRLEHSIGMKRAAETNLSQLKRGLAYECAKAYESGDPIKTRVTYEDFINEQCFRVDNAIKDIQFQMRMMRSGTFATRNTSATTTTTW